MPGLSDLPLIGRLFASNTSETQQTDIILMLTPHIVRVLDLAEDDLRPFRLGREAGGGGNVELPNIQRPPPRDPEIRPSIELRRPSPLQPSLPGRAAGPPQSPATALPQPLTLPARLCLRCFWSPARRTSRDAASDRRLKT